MIRRILLVAGLLGTGAQRIAAQNSPPLLVGDPEASAQLASIVADTKQKGLPTNPILTRVGYGVMRHAEPQRIVASARAVASRLDIARDALAPHATDLDIAAGEDALGSAVISEEHPSIQSVVDALRAVRAASPNQPVAVPLGVLSQLLVSGVPVKRATAAVTDLIKRGVPAKQLVALGNDVSSDVRDGARAANALDIRTRGLNAVLPPLGASAAADAPTALSGGTGPKKP
jgi:hypothetical protein